MFGFQNNKNNKNSLKVDGKTMVERKITNFILLFIGRTGSSYIIDMLNSHSDIIAERELLVPLTDSESEYNCLNSLYTKKREANISAVGFKTKLTDVYDVKQFGRILDEFDTKIIYLYRDNIVKQTISRINRKRLHEDRQHHNLERGDDKLPSFSIKPEEFEKWLDETYNRSIEIHQYMHNVKRPQLRISYEDLLNNHDLVFKRIFDFIEVESKKMKSELIKNTSDNLKDVLINYDELKGIYKNTKFEKMFHSVF